MLVIKYLDDKVFDQIDPWGETLESTAWAIRASYHHTIISTPGQAFFGRDVLFNLASVVYWPVLTAENQRQLDIDNFRENARKVMHDYKIGYQLYVKISGIYYKLDYKKQ